MSEHRHNWHIHRSYAVCVELNCNAELTHEEAERRLNATEIFTEEDAGKIADGLVIVKSLAPYSVYEDAQETFDDRIQQLRKYAQILEGKDD